MYLLVTYGYYVCTSTQCAGTPYSIDVYWYMGASDIWLLRLHWYASVWVLPSVPDILVQMC